MAESRIVYTSDATKAVVLADTSAVLTKLSGGQMVNSETSITVGGKHLTITHDNYAECAIEWKAFTFPVTGALDVAALHHLWGWIGFAQRGGEFAIEVDSDLTWATALAANVGVADTSMSLDSTSGISAGDWYFLEELNDPSKWEKHRVDTVTGAGITFQNGAIWDYATDSVIRYHEYFPSCVLMGEVDFHERGAGSGANLYDLRFEFRTVR